MSTSTTFTDKSGVCDGNTKTIIADGAAPRGFMLQNVSDAVMGMNFGDAATTGQGSFLLQPNDFFQTPYGVAVKGPVNLIGTNGKAFTLKVY